MLYSQLYSSARVRDMKFKGTKFQALFFGNVGKCTPHLNSDYFGVILRKSILACSGDELPCDAARRSLKDVVRFVRRSNRRRPLTGSSRMAGREAFIVISRANLSNISKFGFARRVLISSAGWLSVRIRTPTILLSLASSSEPLSCFLFRYTCFFIINVRLFVSYFSPVLSPKDLRPSHSPLMELLSFPFSFSRTSASVTVPSPTLFRRNSLLLLSSRSPRAFQTLLSSRVSYRSSCNLSSSK